MYYAPQIRAKQNWVDYHHSNFVLEDTYATATINGSLMASSIKGEAAFDLLSLTITEEIDPMFLSTPIPNGKMVWSFAGDDINAGGFYDDVADTFAKDMPVSFALGYKHGGVADTVPWTGYFITSIEIDPETRKITFGFEHSVSKASEKQMVPLWATYVGTTGVLRQLSEALPELDFDNVSLSYDSAPRTNVNATIMETLTWFQNSLPFQLATNNDDGDLTAYQGYHARVQPVYIWDVEIFSSTIVKETFDVGLEKIAASFYVTFYSGDPDYVYYDKENREALEDEKSVTWEKFNFYPIQTTLDKNAYQLTVSQGWTILDDRLLPYPASDPRWGDALTQIKDQVNFYQSLQCVSDIGGRCVYIPAQNSSNALYTPDPMVVATRTLTIRHRELQYAELTPAPKNVNVIKNPFRANIDACYTYPKENFKFVLTGEMRDNPSYKLNQVVRIPYNDVWADMLIVKTTRSFTGGSRLKFEGIIINITNIPIHVFNIQTVLGSLQLHPVSDDPGNKNLDYVLVVNTTVDAATPPLISDTIVYNVTVNVPGREPMTHSGIDNVAEFTLGTLSAIQWAGTTATVSVTYGSMTKNATMVKGGYVSFNNPQSALMNYFNAGQNPATMLLPNK